MQVLTADLGIKRFFSTRFASSLLSFEIAVGVVPVARATH